MFFIFFISAICQIFLFLDILGNIFALILKFITLIQRTNKICIVFQLLYVLFSLILSFIFCIYADLKEIHRFMQTMIGCDDINWV